MVVVVACLVVIVVRMCVVGVVTVETICLSWAGAVLVGALTVRGHVHVDGVVLGGGSAGR